ncbi:MAG: GlsB/YeaQ/YmgE family stress response membrane protein [Planctomycetota bacterium]|nr:MAG: GlsB/YeaQ/YmgE family stress response membrane protein [Planctomycetota bacterium]
MTIGEFILLLIVAGICGSIAQALAGINRGGCLVSIALGFIGALLGTWLARTLDLPELFAVQFGDRPFPIIWSIVGASLFAAVLALLSRRPRPR